MQSSEATDVGDFTRLDLVATISEAATGTSPTLLLQHAPRQDTSAWLDFSDPIAIDLTATGTSWFHIEAFTRFVGWSISGTIETSPVVTVELVAKR